MSKSAKGKVVGIKDNGVHITVAVTYNIGYQVRQVLRMFPREVRVNVGDIVTVFYNPQYLMTDYMMNENFSLPTVGGKEIMGTLYL